MIKKYVMLIVVLLVILMLTSTSTATFLFHKGKIYERLPENSLLKNTLDRFFQICKNIVLWRKTRIDFTKAEQNGWTSMGDNRIFKEYPTETISPDAPTKHTACIFIKFDEIMFFIVNSFGVDDADPKNHYSCICAPPCIQYSQEFITKVIREVGHNLLNENEPLPAGNYSSGDGKCPSGCTYSQDTDCPPTPASERTGIVSGRILYDNILLKPVYDASVLVNGKPAEMYGTTYLALNVSAGEVTVEAHDSEGQTMEETLTVEPSVVNSVDLIFPIGEEGTPPDVTSTSDHLQFRWENGMSVELKLKGDELLGIGEVKVNEIPLRKPLLTGPPKIEKIENDNFVRIRYGKCLFIDYETKGETVVVHSKLVTGEGNIDLDWIFTPWEMEVEENQYKGLGYRFSISSPMNISKMEFKCSWELNENIIGKSLLTRRKKTDWERDCKQSEGFEIITLSLLSGSQPPTYQHDDSGALSSFIWPPGELDNTLKKNSNSDQLWFYDKFLFGETRQADTPFRVVLYTSKGGLDEYTYLLDQVYENYRKFYGQEEVTLLPTILASNYLRETVQPGIAPSYRKAIDNHFPEFTNLSFKQATILYVWISNGRIGDPYNGNRLATHNIEVHPDDVDELLYFMNKTHDTDMKLTVWLSTCYSKESPLYDTYEWRIKNVDGSYPSAHSGDVHLMSYRSGYLAYALKRLKTVKEEFEFDGIWHDSFTPGFKIDYSDKCIRPPIDQQMQFLSATQQMGYSPYLESLSPFGMTAVGSVAVTPQGSPRGDRDINAAFGGREYLAYKTSFTLWHPDDYFPMQIDYYKFLANKAVPMIAYLFLDETEKDIVSQANKDYIDALLYMDKRHVLSNDEGVLWCDKESNTQVLFVYKEFSHDLERDINEVFDITCNSVVEIKSGSFTTQPNHTYKLQ